MRDPARDQLVSRYGPYSQKVASHDAEAERERLRQQGWKPPQEPGTVPGKPPAGTGPGDARPFWIGVLLLGAAAVVWQIAVGILAEYRAGLSTLRIALGNPTAGSSLLLFITLALSLAATMLVLGRVGPVRRLPRWARLAATVIATVPAMLPLALLGALLAEVPAFGTALEGVLARVSRGSPTSPPAALAPLLLGATAVIVCVPLLLLLSLLARRAARRVR